MAISLKMTEDTERLGARDKCLEYLRHHEVDVGLTSSASSRPRFLLGIHTRVAKKGVLIKEKSGSTPLRDTDALYNDFDYEVTNR